MFSMLMKRRALSKAFGCLSSDDAEALKESMAKGVDPNGKRRIPDTPFHECLLLKAVELHAYRCIDLLCQEGANPNQFNEVGSSPFRDALIHMERLIDKTHLSFTPELAYETAPEFTAVVQLFLAGGDRKYWPDDLKKRVYLDARGPSPENIHFDLTIDAWLEHQSARMRAQQLNLETVSNAPSAGAKARL